MRFLRFCLLGVLLLGTVFAAGPIHAAEAPASAPAFAVVDMEKVISGYEAYNQANVEFRRYFREAERQLEMNRRLRLLDDKEVQELKDLRAIIALSPEQRARLEQLESLSDAREREFIALEQKSGALTPEEEARRHTLAEIAAKRAPDVAAEERRLTEARQKRNEEMSTPFNEAIGNALEKVAKKNKVAMIFNKDMVLWAALDLTDAVLAELNKPSR